MPGAKSAGVGASLRAAPDGASADARRLVVVVFNGVSLGIMSFAFGVFDMAVHHGALPGLDVRLVSGEPDGAVVGGGLAFEVPYDLRAIGGRT